MKPIHLFVIIHLICLETTGQVIIFQATTANINEAEIRKELAMYPATVIHEYLDTIVILTDHRFCGRAFIDKKFELNGSCTNAKLKATIHHELSSIFLQRYDLYVNPIYNDMWRNFVNWNGANYQYNGIESPERIIATDTIANYYYASKYAQRDFENDLNVIAENLFTEGNKVVRYMNDRKGTAIAKKISAVMDFYFRLNPVFSSNFFKNVKK